MDKKIVEKKIALLKELGMTDSAMYLESIQEASDLTRMRFIPTMMDDVTRKIRKIVYAGYEREHAGTVIPVIITIVVAVLSVMAPSARFRESGGPQNWKQALELCLCVNAFSLLVWIPHWICGFGWTDTRTMSLNRWPDDIPYGGLLAVKEAKERGFVNFQIHYPVDAQRLRMKVDPVITAERGERMYEIFAWDDGKVYE